MKTVAVCLLGWSAVIAQNSPLQDAIETARGGPARPELKARIAKAMSGPQGVVIWGQDYLFVATSPSAVTISIDHQPAVPLASIPGSNNWMLLTKMRTGVTHSYQYYADGKPLGARGDAVGYNPDSYPKPGVPKGQLSGEQSIVSKVFDVMKSDYWVYASPGVDPAVPSALMVWQDGKGLIGEFSGSRLLTVTENLVHQKLIPPMVYVMIQPGTAPDGKALRSIEYDTVSDRYARFLMEAPVVEKMYKLRPDGYSRPIGGSSSGGICAFNVAWLLPDKFARVHSTVGSFTSIQWHPEEKLEGGNVYPFKVRKEPKRNIRVWMSDGADDLENNHGSWPMQTFRWPTHLNFANTTFISVSGPPPTVALRVRSIFQNLSHGSGAITIRTRLLRNSGWIQPRSSSRFSESRSPIAMHGTAYGRVEERRRCRA